MKTGACGLCRASAHLHDSHLLPSALYKLSREPSLKNPNPVIFSGGAAVASSVQARQYFLCTECEDRLNNDGEKWILRNCAQSNTSFPLHTHLTSRPHVAVIDN